jgi:hypothetical protein
MRYFFSIFLLSVLFGACEKKVNSPALLFVYPEANYFNAKSYDILEFDIRGSSGSYLTRFSVQSKPEASISSTVFDTSLNTPNFNLVYQYQAPPVAQTTKITLEFILNDDAGNQTRVAKILTISPANKTPVETAGNEMFSSLSGKQNAYDLSLASPLFSSTAPASSQHIKDETQNDTLINVDTLSRKWSSPAGLNFVRFNDFDYANASYLSIKQAYEAGIKKNFIDQITHGDIILTRLPDTDPDSGYIAVKLVYIIDDDSTNFDRYIFNFKK